LNNTIEIQNLNFSFDEDNLIINDLSLSMNKGDFLSVLGASGSGKSTLLRLLSNILPANKSQILEGTVSVFGKTPKEYLDTGKLSFMFQEASLMPNLNVKENIVFPLKLRRENIDSSFVNELLEVVGLSEHSFKFPSELSGGMKTRVSLARAFVTKPELLLLDEPFSALDMTWRYELYGYLYEFTKLYNTSVIIVTHDIQEAILLGNKIFVLSKKGKQLTTREIIDSEKGDFSFDSVNKVLEDNFKTILGLQNDILIDANRSKLLDRDEFDKTLNEIIESVNQNNENNKVVFEKIQQLRSLKNDPKVQEQMYDLWKKSLSKEFKFEALWFLTDFSFISTNVQEDIYQFILENDDFIIDYGQNQEYFIQSELLLKTKNRIENPEYPETKNWLYLVNALLMSKGNSELVLDVVEFVEDFISKKPNTSFIQYAIHFLNKIRNEK
jgi:ABC-type nitrate/sulfonate/bicarbonate transport system ATPase subunit